MTQPRAKLFAILWIAIFTLLFLSRGGASPALAQDQKSSAPAASGQDNAHGGAEFARTADEILQQMSDILQLPIKHPLKKSLRSKEEIRAYLIREENEDKNDDQRYADRKSLEAFGLIPKDFPLDSFMIDVLTDQIAGLYDPKAGEFYIADWIPADEQKSVMAHELTHALVDQSFRLDDWIKAARPDDDAELARDSVSEGSAIVAMIDYSLLDQKITVRELPDVTGIIRSGAVAEMEKDPLLSKAPMVIRDELLFPYLAGTTFTQQFLKANAGWQDFHKIFENPPVSSAQMIHPELYLRGVKPAAVTLPKWGGLIPSDWKLLEENALGEFGLHEVLKQFVDEAEADRVAPYWDGDRYAVFEDSKTKRTPLALRIHLDSTEDAARFFGQYSTALELKYKTRTELLRRPNYFQFHTASGGVFFRCVGSDCVSLEGAERDMFEKLNHAIGWPTLPAEKEPAEPTAVTGAQPLRLRTWPVPATPSALAAR